MKHILAIVVIYLVMGILDALHELGLDAPKDLSLVGFDDMPFASLLDPPITTGLLAL